METGNFLKRRMLLVFRDGTIRRLVVKIRLHKHEFELEAMDRASAENPDRNTSGRNWPWWEPYVFTVGVLVAFVAFFIACGIFGDFLERIPFGWPVFFGLWTMAAIVESFRKSRTASSLVGNLLLSLFFGLAAVAYATKSDRVLGV